MATFNQQAVADLFAAIKTQAASSGLFERRLGHEPKSAPGNRLSWVQWLGSITPVPRASGLYTTTGQVLVNGRIYAPFLAKDEDATETLLARAVIAMIGLFSADLTVGGSVMEIDLLGAYGVPLGAANVGYIEQDGTHYRVAELTIPVIIDSLWTQED